METTPPQSKAYLREESNRTTKLTIAGVPVLLIVALFLFFLPFCVVSCADEGDMRHKDIVGTITGWGFVKGTSIDNTVLEDGETSAGENIEPNLFAMIAFESLLLAITAFFLKLERRPLLCFLFSATSSICLWILQVYIYQRAASESSQDKKIIASMLLPYWLCIGSLAFAVYLSFQWWKESKKKIVPGNRAMENKAGKTNSSKFKKIAFFGVIVLLVVSGYIRFSYIWVSISGHVYYSTKPEKRIDSFDKKDYVPDAGSAVKLMMRGRSTPLAETVADKNGRYYFKNIMVRDSRDAGYFRNLFLWVIHEKRKPDLGLTFQGLGQEHLRYTDFGIPESLEITKTAYRIDTLYRLLYLKDTSFSEGEKQRLTASYKETCKKYFNYFPEALRKTLGMDSNYSKYLTCEELYDYSRYGNTVQDFYY